MNFLFRILKLILKSGLIFFELFFAFIASYVLISLFFMSIKVGEVSNKKGIEIFMKSDGIHTDFVFPVYSKYTNWTKIVQLKNITSKDTLFQYVSIGWGDQGFFLNTPQWSDLKFSTAFNACFYLGKSAIHANYLRNKDFKYSYVKFSVSVQQYKTICNYVKQSLKKDRNGNFRCIKGRGYWDTDTFYEANGSYGLFNTCNSWVNLGLKKANLPACLWTPLNSGIFHKYR